MKIVEVQFAPWDKIYNFDPDGIDDIVVNDYVVVKTKLGMELGKVIEIKDLPKEKIEESAEGLKPILRKANSDDLRKMLNKNREKEEAIRVCKELIEKHKLPMKLVSVHFSFDGGRATFAFIAEGRVDFRDLVKDLTHHFQKSIRLHQLGIRDEAKLMGDLGVCGRGLCCKKILKDIASVTSDAAEVQQITHRGSERLSGVCGRLMCCLNYEKDGYAEMSKQFPAVGKYVKASSAEGEVIGWHTLKRTIDIRTPEKAIIEIPLGDIKKVI